MCLLSYTAKTYKLNEPAFIQLQTTIYYLLWPVFSFPQNLSPFENCQAFWCRIDSQYELTVKQ